jgi:hypothetical protein
MKACETVDRPRTDEIGIRSRSGSQKGDPSSAGAGRLCDLDPPRVISRMPNLQPPPAAGDPHESLPATEPSSAGSLRALLPSAALFGTALLLVVAALIWKKGNSAPPAAEHPTFDRPQASAGDAPKWVGNEGDSSAGRLSAAAPVFPPGGGTALPVTASGTPFGRAESPPAAWGGQSRWPIIGDQAQKPAGGGDNRASYAGQPASLAPVPTWVESVPPATAARQSPPLVASRPNWNGSGGGYDNAAPNARQNMGDAAGYGNGQFGSPAGGRNDSGYRNGYPAAAPSPAQGNPTGVYNAYPAMGYPAAAPASYQAPYGNGSSNGVANATYQGAAVNNPGRNVNNYYGGTSPGYPGTANDGYSAGGYPSNYPAAATAPGTTSGTGYSANK